MALNAFTFTGGGNMAVGPTPLAVQVSGPTLVVSNVGGFTVYGSIGGSTSASVPNPAKFLTGQPVGGVGADNSSLGAGGFAVPPGGQVVVAVGANGWIWFQTLAGNSTVNIANGT